jgi:hypothetical protein
MSSFAASSALAPAKAVSNGALKTAVARLVCKSVSRIYEAGGSVLVRFGCIRSVLEAEFASDFSSKKEMIMDIIYATITQGEFAVDTGKFTCHDLTLDFNDDDAIYKKENMPSTVQDDDELVYAFGEYEITLDHDEASTDKKTKTPSAAQDPDDAEFVYAFGKFPKPALAPAIISNNILEAAVVRLVRVAVNGREKLSTRSVQRTLEADFACNLSDRKRLVLLYIEAALKKELLRAEPIKTEINNHKRSKLF